MIKKTLLKLALIFFIAIPGIARAEKLSDIINTRGKDYVLQNQQMVYEELDDNDRLRMMGLLFVNMKGRDTERFLLKMAKNNNPGAIRLLVDKYSFGKEGYRSNKEKARFWADKLQTHIKPGDLNKSKYELVTLCRVYEYDTSVIKDKVKASNICSQLFDIDIGSAANYHSMKRSQFYDPSLAVREYKECITDSVYCKVNYAWAAHKNLAIAQNMTKGQIFSLANAAIDIKSAGALNNLGTFYDSGFGTAMDREKALELFMRASNMEAGHAFYNILNMTFFKTVVSEELPQNADEAMALISFYDYKSPEMDKYDSIPFKEWIFTMKRLPKNSEEFKEFLIAKAMNKSEISACAVSSHYIKNNDLANGRRFAKIGLNAENKFVRQWCENNLDAIKVIETLKI